MTSMPTGHNLKMGAPSGREPRDALCALVEAATASLRRGGFVLVTDDVDRENEGDLVIAAEMATESALAMMIRHCSGIICVPMRSERADHLGLPPMVSKNTEHHRTAFTISVDAAVGGGSGVSAADRAATIKTLADPGTHRGDLLRPGHVFPLRYQEGGVLARPGHTEAAIDLVELAGLSPVAVIAEVVNDDGTMKRGQRLSAFARKHGLVMLSVDDLVNYRRRALHPVKHKSSALLPTEYGSFIVHGFESALDGRTHPALVRGEPARRPSTLVRVHSECLTGDALGSNRCDCGGQLRAALAAIGQEDAGVHVYVRGQEGRGIGLDGKLMAYELQDNGFDTVEANLALGWPADLRRYHVAAQILRSLGVDSVQLLTNNPQKRAGLEAGGVAVTTCIPLRVKPSTDNSPYLRAKQDRLGHLLAL